MSKGKINFNELNITNLRKYENEILEYMKKDILLLNKIIISAQKYFNNLFLYLDITRYISLSAISNTIFRTEYLKENGIYKTNKNMEEFIRKGFYGGSVDVYKPKGENLYYYDVNSLYPAMMCHDMPAGKPFFKRFLNHEKLQYDDFGFIHAEIEYYGNLKAPLLPYKKDGVTIFPTGKVKGIYFSEELKKAESLRYIVKPIKEYIFKKDKIFHDCIHTLYNIRINSTEKSINLLIKLILNSFYGRFGMKKYVKECKIVTPEK